MMSIFLTSANPMISIQSGGAITNSKNSNPIYDNIPNARRRGRHHHKITNNYYYLIEKNVLDFTKY